MAYTTAAKVKTYLGISSSSEDTLIGELVTAAQKAIETHCHRAFEASADTTRKFDAPLNGDTYLMLDADLSQITSVTNGNSEALTANTHYVTCPRNITPYYALELTSGGGKSWAYTTTPEKAITIVGRWSYAVSAPEDIQNATIQLAVWLYRRRVLGNLSPNAATMDNGGTTVTADWPQGVLQILAPYIRREA